MKTIKINNVDHTVDDAVADHIYKMMELITKQLETIEFVTTKLLSITGGDKTDAS
jgi:hypothetical protein